MIQGFSIRLYIEKFSILTEEKLAEENLQTEQPKTICIIVSLYR